MPATEAVHDICQRVLNNAGRFQIPGLSERDSIQAVCRVAEYMNLAGDSKGLAATNGQPNEDAVKHAIAFIRRSAFGKFGDSADVEGDGEVQGGLQHVVSADNGAAYWELWHRGGNWYAVTGADPNSGSLLKKAQGEPEPYLIPGVVKGMGAGDVVPRFLRNFFGPAQISRSGGCGLCGGRR